MSTDTTTVADASAEETPPEEAPSAEERRALEDEFIERLKECVSTPEFTERANVADRDSVLATGNVDALREIGITQMVIDPRFGDHGASLDAVVRAMDELSYYDGSTAVALNMHWGAARAVARMPQFPRCAEAFLAVRNDGATMCGAFSVALEGLDSRTSGVVAREAGDTYVLNGRAGFASMSDAATYAVIGSVLEESDPADPTYVLTIGRLGEQGLINHRNWGAMGMRGTGSNDLECKDLVIDKEDCIVGPRSQFAFRRPIDTVFATFGITAIWVGLARAALDFTVDHVKHRYGYMASSSLDVINTSYRADEGWAQTAIGNMDHWLGTGQVVLRDMVARIDTYEDDQLMGRDTVRTVYHLRRMSEEVAMGAMKTCGAHGYLTTRSLERTFRDLMGGIVMAWKTDDMQQKLGVGALGTQIIMTGPAGT